MTTFRNLQSGRRPVLLVIAFFTLFSLCVWLRTTWRSGPVDLVWGTAHDAQSSRHVQTTWGTNEDMKQGVNGDATTQGTDVDMNTKPAPVDRDAGSGVGTGDSDEAQTVNVEPLAKTDAYLVTGCAGFIGFHLTMLLLRNYSGTIVCIDGFTKYYDTLYKAERVGNLLNFAAEQEKFHGRDPATFKFISGDVCDEKLMRSVFDEYQFTHLVHLAAQPGVRFSLKEPQTVIRQNIKCYQVLLDELRHRAETPGLTVPHFVYASSSSVYGSTETIPFVEADPLDQPSNIYGASKRTNELFAKAYHNLFGISSIGLRFFTVYGPFGRPDMAAGLFTEKILKGEPLLVFNEGKMKRDFTFVADIVRGIVKVMEYKTTTPTVFNLGNTDPVPILDMVKTLRSYLAPFSTGQSGVEFTDAKSEIAVTYADSSKALKQLGWKSRTPLANGLAMWSSWYLAYDNIGFTTNMERLPGPVKQTCDGPNADLCFMGQPRLLCISQCANPLYCMSSEYCNTKVKSIAATSGCKVVYITVVTDEISTVPAPDTANIDGKQECAIAFVTRSSVKDEADTDGKVIMADVWKRIDINLVDTGTEQHLDYVKASRVLKIDPKGFMADSVTHTIYVDPVAMRSLKRETQDMLDFLKDDGGTEASFLAVERQYSTDMSIQDELAKIISSGRTDYMPAINRQLQYENLVESLSGEILPSNILPNTGVIIQSIRHEGSTAFRCEWYSQYMKWSDRDEPAFFNAMYKLSEDLKSDYKAALDSKKMWHKMQTGGFVRFAAPNDFYFKKN